MTAPEDAERSCEPCPLAVWRGVLLAMPLGLAVWGLLAWWIFG